MNRAPRLMAIRALEIGTTPRTPSLADWAVNLARAGVDCVQLRDKRAPDRSVYEGARSVVEALAVASASMRLLINRRLDLALAAGAAGVHLPAEGLSVRAVRKAFGETFVIGRSTHSLEEVADARRQGADYVIFGPVFATPEKLQYGPPLGLEQLAGAAALGIPVLAIGGITVERLAAVARAGASGAAAIRLFEDPERASAIVERADEVFQPTGSYAHG